MVTNVAPLGRLAQRLALKILIRPVKTVQRHMLHWEVICRLPERRGFPVIQVLIVTLNVPVLGW
jgi:hypothetical protein